MLEELYTAIGSESGSNRKLPVILISAKRPGCGSTTLAEQLSGDYREKLQLNVDLLSIGKNVRSKLDVGSEEELFGKLEAVPDPLEFDRPFYSNLSPNDLVIREGKIATEIGPGLIDGDRPIVAINLVAPTVINATRVMQRQGIVAHHIIKNPQLILDFIRNIEKRVKHIEELGERGKSQVLDPRVESFFFDTSRFRIEEIVGMLTGNQYWENEAPEWEINALAETFNLLHSLSMNVKIDPRDKEHFENSFESVKYHAKRLKIIKDSDGLTQVRSDIRSLLTHSVFALLMKEIPRFYVANDRQIAIDEDSKKWTPEYYKIMKAWPVLKTKLKDQDILDPFAGAGTFVNVLSARGIPKSVVLGDLSYTKGVPLDDSGNVYHPFYNAQMVQSMFDGLPSWYKPRCLDLWRGCITLDATKLPFSDSSFDWVTGDPPYGINFKDGGIELFIDALPEILRISKKGGIFLVTIKWIDQLEQCGLEKQIKVLTEDLSEGDSHLPTCFIEIKKNN